MKKGETGLTQKKQKEIIEQFAGGAFNVLVSTSIGEEGLDIPSVDLVVFFEPIPSAIRTIQRRGRTGRQEQGRVVIFMTLDTRDVGYRWSAHHKEKRMFRTLEQLKKKMHFGSGSSTQLLESFNRRENGMGSQERPENNPVNITVIVDHREKGSRVIKELIEMNAHINLETLEHADYLLSSQVGVEFKTTEDFVNSLIDGRLLGQLRRLKEQYLKPLVVVEGEQDLYSVRNVHPHALQGMLATILIDYGIPLLFTKNAKETASLLFIIAKREQEGKGETFSVHPEKKEMGLHDIQEYVVSAFPGVGLALARPLLRKFSTIKNFVNASVDELKEVEKIGDVKAKKIKEIVDGEYKV